MRTIICHTLVFSLTGEHKPNPTELERIHLFIPSSFAVKDGASYTGVDLGALTAANSVKANLNSGKSSLEGMGTADATVMSLKAIEGITGDVGRSERKSGNAKRV